MQDFLNEIILSLRPLVNTRGVSGCFSSVIEILTKFDELSLVELVITWEYLVI